MRLNELHDIMPQKVYSIAFNTALHEIEKELLKLNFMEDLRSIDLVARKQGMLLTVNYVMPSGPDGKPVARRTTSKVEAVIKNVLKKHDLNLPASTEISDLPLSDMKQVTFKWNKRYFFTPHLKNNIDDMYWVIDDALIGNEE